MAASNNSRGRTSAKSKTGTSRKKSVSKKKTDNRVISNEVTTEVLLLVVIGFVILLFLSIIGVCGSAGDTISKPFFGLFGMLAYIFPFVVGYMIAMLIANDFSGAAKIKSLGLSITYIAVCGLLHVMDNRAVTATVKEMYDNSSINHIGGGVVGGGLYKLLSPFGFGAIVIICLLIIIGLVVLTEKSFIRGVKEQSTKVYKKTMEDIDSYKQDVAEKNISRQEKRANGVDISSTLIPKDGIKNNDVRNIDKKVQNCADKYNDDIFDIVPTKKNDEASIEQSAENVDTFASSSKKSKQKVMPYLDKFVDIDDSANNEDTVNPFKVVTDSNKHETDASFATALDTSDVSSDASSDASPHASSDEKSVGKASGSDTASLDGVDSRRDVVKDMQEKQQQEDTTPLLFNEEADEQVKYQFPPVSLLTKMASKKSGNSDIENRETAKVLQQTLQSFGVNVTITDVSCGPTVTRYELLPERGTKVSKIVSLADDIKLNLAAADIRIEAPIPGKQAVGIEVPNKEAAGVSFRELIESEEFKNHSSKIAFAAGKDISGKVIMADIAKMPHLLIAGATGSGKSVCINTIIMSILYKAKPDEVKLILIDPKVVELSIYNGIPHLMIPVVTDPKKASQALAWAVAEMSDRYKKFAKYNVRDLKGYNEKVVAMKASDVECELKVLPQLVIVIDELADLMMVAPGEVEDAICRLAQLARACGIHLVIATQRPSVNVITGLIKANVPSRIAFAVSSGVDSRTILDMNGAEKLLGKGDMLFYPAGLPKPIRAQGAFVSDKEVSAVVEFLSNQHEEVQYNDEVVMAIESAPISESQAFGGDRDQYFAEAGRFVIEKERASIGLIQRFYKVGFNRAARIMDQLCDAGVVGPEEGTKPRKILMTLEEFEEYLKQN